jgi:hypothetical protein
VVTDVDEVVSSLQQVETAVRSAIGAAERAGRFAERLEQDLGKKGLRRMALRMREVSTSIRQTHKQLGVQAQTVASMSAAVSTAPVATDPTVALAALEPASSRLSDVERVLGLGVDRVGQQQALVADILRGARPGPLLGMLDEVAKPLRQGIECATTSRKQATELVAEVRAAGQAAATGSPATTTTTGTAVAPHATVSVVELSSSDSAHVRRLNQPPANATIVVDGRFRYETDDQGRVVKANATLETIDLEHPRSEHAQKTLSGKLPGDDAGHLFARIFKGPGQKVNLAPMESLGVNRGEYGRLERLWREKIEAGEQVEVEVRLVYSDADDRRPTAFRIRHRHTVGGEFAQVWKRVNIDNTPAER